MVEGVLSGMEQVRPCASLGVFAGIRSAETQVRPLHPRNLMSDRPVFKIYQAPHWADLKALSRQLRFPYAFRGQPSVDYRLSTHMERAARRQGCQGNSIPRKRAG